MAITLIICAVVSYLPIALLNIHFTGDYSGDPDNKTQFKLSNPVSGVVGNGLILAKDNLVPPVLLHPIDWQPYLPSYLSARLRHDYPRLDLRSSELQIEEGAGVGLGVVLFAALCVGVGISARVLSPYLVATRNNRGFWVALAGLAALLAYMAKMGIPPASRIVAAYYPMTIACFLVLASLEGRMIHRRVFRWVGLLAMLSAIPLVILCPARPLFPVRMVSNVLARCHVAASLITRFDQVYDTYAARADVFNPLLLSVPAGEHVIGFLQIGDDPEADLWRPFGTRKVMDVTPVNSRAEVEAKGIHYVLISQEALVYLYHTSISTVASQWAGTIAVERQIVVKAKTGPQTWYVLKM